MTNRQERLAEAREIKRRLAAYPALLEAAKAALDHIQELEEAWCRGALSERDGKGGTRSNRNAEVGRHLRAAIAAIEGGAK